MKIVNLLTSFLVIPILLLVAGCSKNHTESSAPSTTVQNVTASEQQRIQADAQMPPAAKEAALRALEEETRRQNSAPKQK
jgi:outer membrane murein-binding lipoprotein Lpp